MELLELLKWLADANDQATTEEKLKALMEAVEYNNDLIGQLQVQQQQLAELFAREINHLWAFLLVVAVLAAIFGMWLGYEGWRLEKRVKALEARVADKAEGQKTGAA